jgi:hypothetical protein
MKSLFTPLLLFCFTLISAQSKFDLGLGMRRVSAGEYIQVSTGYNWNKRHRTEFGIHGLIPLPNFVRNNNFYYRNYRPRHLDDYIGYHISHEYMFLRTSKGTSFSIGFDIDKSSSWIQTWVVLNEVFYYFLYEENLLYYSGLMDTNLKLNASFKIKNNFYLILEGGGGASWGIRTKQDNIWWRTFKPGLPAFSNGIGYYFNGLSKFFSAGIRYNFNSDNSDAQVKTD